MRQARFESYLAALDQVGMRFEDGIYLLRGGNLFAIEHTTACLVDNARAEHAIMRDLLAQGRDVQGGERSLPRIAAVSSSAILALATTSSAIAISAR
jgi:hypothetical protein